jgi:hypothetical protein
MTITFENDNDVIVYALEKIISYARNNQQIFVAQCVWWLASIIGLEQGLANFIDNIQSRIDTTVIPGNVPSADRIVSPIPRDIQEDLRQDKVLKECEEYLKDSKRLREIAALKATGKSLSGFINPTAISKKQLRKKDRHLRKKDQIKPKTRINKDQKTEGIQLSEINRRKSSGECLRCAWPFDRKGSHQVATCIRPIKLDKGTASFPKAKDYKKAKQATPEIPVEEESSESSSFEESSDDSL